MLHAIAKIGIGRTGTFLFFQITIEFRETRISDIAGKNDATYLYRQEVCVLQQKTTGKGQNCVNFSTQF